MRAHNLLLDAMPLVALFSLPAALGQQLPHNPLPLHWLGLSDSCFSAVNITVECPAWLNEHALEL